MLIFVIQSVKTQLDDSDDDDDDDDANKMKFVPNKSSKKESIIKPVTFNYFCIIKIVRNSTR